MPPKDPVSFFGWLMNCCVKDDGPATSQEDALPAALLFLSGVAASGVTLYLAGFFHIL